MGCVVDQSHDPGSAIPNISALIVIVGALCILHFTYTFPPILWLAYMCQKDAARGEETWRPGMPYGSNRIDTWRDMSRWKRGFGGKYWYVKPFLILMFVGALVLCGLGAYAGVEGFVSLSVATGADANVIASTESSRHSSSRAVLRRLAALRPVNRCRRSKRIERRVR